MARSLAAVTVAALALTVAACAPRPVQAPSGPGDGPIRYVIHVSVDGLRPDAVTRQLGALPAFARLRREAAFTDNARTDPDYSDTLPNHTAQLTGRGVTGPEGHGWTSNVDPDPDATLHANHGAYVASVFGVVHDAGLRTALYASKSKFVLFDQSYDADSGRRDTTGADDGRDKIDRFVYEPDTEHLVDRLAADTRQEPSAYAFVHLRDPDAAGHVWGWQLRASQPYMRAVRRADARIGEILRLIETDGRLAGHTALIVTADHGGTGHNHLDAEPAHYTVPFYVWAPGVPAGDLYARNARTLGDPARARPGFDAALQPIRNGAAANLALALLGLGPVPGSTINAHGELHVLPDSAASVPVRVGS